MARIYRPQGTGPFPVVLDLHGGAWNAKDRFAEEPMNRSMAASGLLVVAIDLTLAAEDGTELVRWLRAEHPAIAILVLSMQDEALFATSPANIASLTDVVVRNPDDAQAYNVRGAVLGQAGLDSAHVCLNSMVA